ncbi:MAG TPA: ATP-binding protein [Gemmataceae bacterium]|nr:ATP-binding protein [Gemmataceae bacterium]
MSVDPQVIRAEPHTEIGNLIQLHAGTILERWSHRAVQEQPQAPRVHHAVLLNDLRDFLQTLGRSLAESQAPSTCSHCLPASNHGAQRWQTGWSLPEVVRDYQILRLVLVEFLEETLDRPLGYREVLAIGLALDEAISASVVKYVQGRDQEFHELQANHIEENRQVQQRLRVQAEALREADRHKNEFLAMLAHELRNPLAPVRNAVQFLMLKGSADPELQWAGEVIDRQVQHMSRMVDDLLDISRIAQGKIKLEKVPVELATVVARAMEMVRPLVDARKHQATIAIPPEPVWLEADPPRVVQVLANLLTNAAKYTDEGGQIWLTMERQADEAVITVRDTGIGIPSEMLPKVFDLFAQGDRNPDPSQGGLGIGLSLVRSLVDLHGGRVQASSAGRGHGSEFVVHLPILQQTPPATPETRKPVEHSSAPAHRILVVDDNKDAAQSLALLLKLCGQDVRTANDGPAALEIARTYVPEIVLLDIGLPHMDGLEVARRLRHDLGLKDTLLVALTGYGQEEDRRRSEEAGFNAHLVKPLDLHELHKLLARPTSSGSSEGTAEKG